MRKIRSSNIYLLNEFTDICNLRCIMCDHGRMNQVHGGYPAGIMKEELFERIISCLKDNRLHLDCFHAGWLGEPLCHPQFPKLIKKLFEEDKVYNLFDSFTINTNALLLNKETADVFLEYAKFLEESRKGFLRVHLSIHAATAKMYKKITNRPKEDIANALNNIDYLMSERKKRNLRFPSLTFLFVVTKVNKNEAEKFLKYWSGRLEEYGRKYEVVYDWPENHPHTDTDAIYFRREDAYKQYEAEELHKQVIYSLGLIPKEKLRKRIIRTDAVLRKNVEERNDLFRRPCPALWRTLVVHNTGLVVPCCSDLHLELKIGDLNNQSLEEIWNGPEITNIRLAHIRGDFYSYKRCYYCNNIDSFVISDQEIVQYLEDIDRKDEIQRFLDRMPNNKIFAPINKRNLLNVCLLSREYPLESGWGGIGTYTYELAHGLAKSGHNVHVIALSLDGDKKYMDGNIHIHRLSHYDLFSFKRPFLEFAVRLEYSYRLYLKLKEIINRYNIDIVEAPNFFAEPFIYSIFKKIPLVIRLHSPYAEIIKAYGWQKTLDHTLSCSLEDFSIMRCDMVISSTDICARAMAEQLGIDYKKIEVIPLGVNIPDINELQSLNSYASNGKLEVLFIGRLEYRKGVHVLMQAIPHVLEKLPNTHFTFIGRDTFLNARYSSFEGTKEESIKESLLKYFPKKYFQNIRFLGYVDKENLSDYLSSCDVFVAPSLYESFGLIYIEAMAYGKPVIGCNVGGVPEVVKDGETGILVPPENIELLAKAIISLLNDSGLRLKMGNNAREYVKNNFTREIMVEKTLAVYKKVLKIQ